MKDVIYVEAGIYRSLIHLAINRTVIGNGHFLDKDGVPTGKEYEFFTTLRSLWVNDGVLGAAIELPNVQMDLLDSSTLHQLELLVITFDPESKEWNGSLGPNQRFRVALAFPDMDAAYAAALREKKGGADDDPGSETE